MVYEKYSMQIKLNICNKLHEQLEVKSGNLQVTKKWSKPDRFVYIFFDEDK